MWVCRAEPQHLGGEAYSPLFLLPQTHPASEPAGAAEESQEQIWTHLQVSTGSPPPKLRLEHWGRAGSLGLLRGSRILASDKKPWGYAWLLVLAKD